MLCCKLLSNRGTFGVCVIWSATKNYSYPKVTAALQPTNNEWEMTVAYSDGVPPLWFPLCVSGTVLLTFLISLLVYALLT